MSPPASPAGLRLRTGGWLFGLVLLGALVLPFVGGPFRGAPVGLALICFFFPLLARREPLRAMLVNLFTLPERGQRVMAALAVPFLTASVAVQFEVADPSAPWLGVFARPEQLGLALLLALPWILIISWDSAPAGGLAGLLWAPAGLLLSSLVLLGLSALEAPIQAWVDRVWPKGSVELFFTLAVLAGAMVVVTWTCAPGCAVSSGGAASRLRSPRLRSRCWAAFRWRRSLAWPCGSSCWSPCWRRG